MINGSFKNYTTNEMVFFDRSYPPPLCNTLSFFLQLPRPVPITKMLETTT